MKTTLALSALLLLLSAAAASPCFGMMSIELVSKKRAKALGMEVRATAAGPDIVRVEIAFDVKGELKYFSRVDLEMHGGGKLLMSATLQPDRSTPGRAVVGFTASRGDLEKFTLRVVTEQGPRSRTGHDLRVHEFFDLEKVR